MRALIYDATVLPLTSGWYRRVLERLAPGTHLLDVGIGTGGALARNARTLRDRDLRVTGVDIDEQYLRRCRGRIRRRGLDDRVDVLLESIYEHRGGPYGAAYFSASFMLMPAPADALRHVCTLLSDGARVFFTQTFQVKRSAVVERAKPLLRKVTTIEFGEVTYEEDFRLVLDEAGLDVVEVEELSRGPTMSGRLVVGRPRPR